MQAFFTKNACFTSNCQQEMIKGGFLIQIYSKIELMLRIIVLWQVENSCEWSISSGVRKKWFIWFPLPDRFVIINMRIAKSGKYFHDFSWLILNDFISKNKSNSTSWQILSHFCILEHFLKLGEVKIKRTVPMFCTRKVAN